MNRRSKQTNPYGPLVLILAHLVLVLPLAYYLNIWADEGSTLHTTQHGLLTALQNAASDERQAPFYFWVLSLWRMINDSIFFARLFSVVCSVIAIQVFSRLARRLFEPRSALLTTAFFALHPYLIWASLEIRGYALVILLSILILQIFFYYFFNSSLDSHPRPAIKGLILFWIIGTIALYTNYYLGFLLAGSLFALVITRRNSEIRTYSMTLAAIGLAFIPLAFSMKSQFVASQTGVPENNGFIAGLRYVWRHFLTFILPAEIFPDEEASSAALLRLWIIRLFLVAGTIYALTQLPKISSRTVAFGAIFATVSLFLLAANLFLGPRHIEIRHASVLFVPTILFFTSLLRDLLAGLRRTRLSMCAIAVSGILVLISFSYSFATLYPATSKHGDWARIGAYIEQHESRNQPIIVFKPYDAMALPYHYHGVNQVLPDKRFFDFETKTSGADTTSVREQADFTISMIPDSSTEIWLVVNDRCSVTDICIPLEQSILPNYDVIQDVMFNGERVRLLRRK